MALYNADEFRSSDHDPVVVGLIFDGDGGGDDDSDGDGVIDELDNCPGTVIPELVPTRKLKNNRWALTDDDFVFDTKTRRSRGNNNNRGYTTTDTAGCSCEQIIEAQGLGTGHTKFGCSNGVMRNWVRLVTP
jgi:hypothetical protein